ncbi:MAG: DUF2235 domain-containing protein [Proteobacteria bacterium]|uniref:DUF2235 domain-containing protein n=1 Tax=Sphingopyxis terrae TaxID=33052 RepID=UPI000787F5C7|nr:DUF2235 domain-containing protein [Sphingopyxis terrae]MCA0210894.1 DUF2235 domain-containing protein [Pseudomonadota bacterium]
MEGKRPRNVIVCCDGTSNQPAKHQTNVARLVYALEKDIEAQHVYYQPGLGTRASPGFPLPVGNYLARVGGMAFGYGIKDDLRDAYVFIMNHWRPGDQLFLFGFSRGAYTVRILAALLSTYGVPMPGNEALLPYAIKMFWRANGAEGAAFDTVMTLARRFKANLSMAECKPHFVGVWDTVSSVGWIGTPVALPYTGANPDIAHIRHAIALDEKRAFFRTNRFRPHARQDCAEMWFPGDHCDVGGGHAESASGLSKYSLRWMADEAAAKGLGIDKDRLADILGESEGSHFTPASPKAEIHRMPFYWWPAEFLPKKRWDNKTQRTTRRLNLFRRRRPPKNALIHPVAWDIDGYAERYLKDFRRPEAPQ